MVERMSHPVARQHFTERQIFRDDLVDGERMETSRCQTTASLLTLAGRQTGNE
jgi:hypothetical protein